MPLDPKQQPPYYTPATTGTQSGLTKLFTQTTSQQTTDTTPIQTANYSIPANSWTEGQIIEATYWGNAYNTAAGVEKSLYIDGNQEPLTNIDGNLAYNVKLSMIRIPGDIIKYTIISEIEDEPTYTIQGSYSADFTLPIEIYLDIAATTSGNIRLSAAYITKIS